MFFGLTRSDIKSITIQLAFKKTIESPFSVLNQSFGKNWSNAFIKNYLFGTSTGTMHIIV